jgi:nucleoside 2-deoxyribosyltransferase
MGRDRMRIVLAGSMSALELMKRVAAELEAQGHSVILPDLSEAEQELERSGVDRGEQKRQLNVIRRYYERIGSSDVLLVVNPEKNGIEGYVGANTFLEMGFAFVLEKQIYVLNPIGELPYSDEIVAMEPVVLNDDLSVFDA